MVAGEMPWFRSADVIERGGNFKPLANLSSRIREHYVEFIGPQVDSQQRESVSEGTGQTKNFCRILAAGGSLILK